MDRGSAIKPFGQAHIGQHLAQNQIGLVRIAMAPLGYVRHYIVKAIPALFICFGFSVAPAMTAEKEVTDYWRCQFYIVGNYPYAEFTIEVIDYFDWADHAEIEADDWAWANLADTLAANPFPEGLHQYDVEVQENARKNESVRFTIPLTDGADIKIIILDRKGYDNGRYIHEDRKGVVVDLPGECTTAPTKQALTRYFKAREQLQRGPLPRQPSQ